jgi:hypothetical protein
LYRVLLAALGFKNLTSHVNMLTRRPTAVV